MYISQTVADKFADARSMGIFWRLDGDDPLRLWMGFGDFPVVDKGTYLTGFPSVDVEDDTYIGLGLINNMPDLDVLINGKASRVDFSLSGVDERVLEKLEEEPPTVSGAVVRIGIAPLDSRWQALSAIIPLWTGVADYWAVNQATVRGRDSPVNVAMLSCYDGGASRARPPQMTLTPAVQKKLHPDDLFCDNVGLFRRGGFNVPWPRF